jgi:hypothetical protein
MVWLVEDLEPISNDQRIAKAGLNDSAQDIEICEVEFEIGDSEIIVEFSNDCHRLEAVAVLVKKKSLEVDRKTKEKWSENDWRNQCG